MEEKRPKFLSFAEATDWAFAEATDWAFAEATAWAFAEATAWAMEQAETAMEKKENTQDVTKEIKFHRWLIEVGELQEQLETQLDNAQDLWIAGEEFKSWLVKHEGAWFDVERSMQQVYSHIDSALHFLRIIRGVKKDD